MIKIQPIGGYGEIGRNMTLVTVDNESIILDMGYHMERLVTVEHDEELVKLQNTLLRTSGIVADDSDINKKIVKAIIPSHGHLDHIGAIPHLEKGYSCPIYATPFTAQVIKRQFKDNNFKQKNPIRVTPFEKKVKLSSTLSFEFFPITHSIPDTGIIIIHTPYGQIVYANDFKLDRHPTIGKKPALKKLQKKLSNPIVLISECLRAQKQTKTESELVAKHMLEDILFTTDLQKKGIFLTTFSSHIERLQTIVRYAQRLKRKVIFFGRSLEKYTSSAKKAKVSKIIDDVEIVPYRSMIKRRLKKIMANNEKQKYVFVMTGHQAEEKAVLNAIATGKLPLVFDKNDIFIYSCNVIPTPSIIEARHRLDAKLESLGLRLFKDVHVSGHASYEDLRELLTTIKPKHVIPAHGELPMMDAYALLAKQEGYILGQTLHLLVNGQSIEIEDDA